MIATKVTKQSLTDWSVENKEPLKLHGQRVNANSTLVWISKDRDGIFKISYTQRMTLCDVAPDYKGSFKEAKAEALRWIDHFTKD